MPALAPASEIDRALKKILGVGADTLQSLDQNDDGLQVLDADKEDDLDLANAAQDASIIRFVNQILTEAIEMRATDVHIEPFEDQLRVALSHRRRAGRGEHPASGPAVSCRDRVAHQDSFAPGHRRKTPAAGRPHQAEDRRARDRHSRVGHPDDSRRSGRAAYSRSRRRGAGHRAPRHGRARSQASSTRSSTCRTASCWSPGRPVRAKPRRFMRRCPRSTTPNERSSPSKIPVEYQLRGVNQIQVNTKSRPDLRRRASRDFASRSGRGADRRNSRPAKPPRSRCRRRSPATWCSRRCTPTTPRRRDATDRHGHRAVSGCVIA